MKAYTGFLPLAKALLSADNTAPGIPCSNISIDQRAASAILSTTVAARY